LFGEEKTACSRSPQDRGIFEMPRICPICVHPNREEIECQLAAGVVPTGLARRYRLSVCSMKNHKANNMGEILGRALRGEYEGDISHIRSITITTRITGGAVDKC
jgi:hypothetical protein